MPEQGANRADALTLRVLILGVHDDANQEVCFRATTEVCGREGAKF